MIKETFPVNSTIIIYKVSLQGVACQHVIMNNNHTRVSVQTLSEAFFTFSSIHNIMRRPIFDDVSLLSSFEDGSFDEVNGNIMYYAMLHPFTSAPVWPQSRA